ncbi:protein SPEC3-like [Carcharodon carcharias]|uniref:protein SPEC3-like n=1 Tax=Carcharodon carcharias TaxID=13397 RepID=UPI001B7DB99D|nr:protein SPEC3-like [Carcharodon carcharias]
MHSFNQQLSAIIGTHRMLKYLSCQQKNLQTPTINKKGTILSGFTLLCCSEPATPTGHKTNDEILTLVCLNVWVGISQLFTVPFLLVGWLWSITWGVMMINLSYEQRNDGEAQAVTMEAKTETVFLPS